ncbi:hypothetical protein [Prevotella sp. OH937_COT-195]|uniref:hypothetical protein n=1 Tax=Prevotella sp. OH937_COT-195 TaxID=2491051 RepID=UPI000F64A848|nr:hypothetical protein [Prevotella sp. OH937_COT-195]RRD02356.1 hypothetical protein EII32_02810 [Prevotella sp. OH937_COT-195]
MVILKFLSGFIICISALFLWFNPYNYVFATTRKVYISSDTSELVQSINNQKRIYKVDISKTKFLKEMRSNGELITSDEFASRITSYYDTLVGVLGVMFVLFTFGTYFSMKQTFERKFEDKVKEIDKEQNNISNRLKADIRIELKEMLRNYRDVRNDIVESITGSIVGEFITYEEFDSQNSLIEDVISKQKDIMVQLGEIQENFHAKESIFGKGIEMEEGKGG